MSRESDRPEAAEGFAARWSRRKQEAEAAPEPSPPDDAAQAQRPPVTDADLPDPETLGPDADYRGFLSPGVSDALRRRALRRLFADPGLNLSDGLDDYAEDMSGAAGWGGQLLKGLVKQARESDGALDADGAGSAKISPAPDSARCGDEGEPPGPEVAAQSGLESGEEDRTEPPPGGEIG